MTVLTTNVATSNADTATTGQASVYQLLVDNLLSAGSHYLPYTVVNGTFIAPPGPQDGYIPRLPVSATTVDVVTNAVAPNAATSPDPASWNLHTAETFSGSFGYDAAGNPVTGTLASLNVNQVLRVTAADHTNSWSDLNTFAAGTPEAALLASLQAQGAVFDAMSMTGAAVDVATLANIAATGTQADALAYVFSGNDTITGSTGNDTLYGYGGNDTISGGAGNDIIDPGTGTNKVDAGAGNDIIISGSGTNGTQLTPGNGIDGGSGFDTVVYNAPVANYHIVTIAGASGYTRVTDVTSGQSDIIVNVEKLQFGDTSIYLGAAPVPVVSGAVTGAATEDGATVSLNLLANATDADPSVALGVTNLPSTLPAGVSYDPATGNLTLDPSAAAYQSLAAGQTTTVTVNYGVTDGTNVAAASASFTVTGVNDAAVIGGATTGSVTEDTTLTASGQLTVSDPDSGQSAFTPVTTPLQGQYGALTMDASGAWTYTLNNALPAVQALNSGQSVVDQLRVQSVDGTATTLSITVNGRNEPPAAITGTAGNDTLAGTSGDDHIYGLGGRDTIDGGAGNDTIDGGAGSDTITGGADNDSIVYDAADKSVDGGTGNDTLLVGGTIKVNLASIYDQVSGDAGKTTGFENVDASKALGSVDLTGSAGVNVLIGGAGRDIINGNGGADILTGGAGADTFVFKALAPGDAQITDFAFGSDRLDLTALFHGSAASLAAHLRVQDTAAGTVISTDIGTGGGFAAMVTLDGVHGVSAASLAGSGSLTY